MMTVLIALIGFALFVWGMALYLAFGLALRAFARVQATGAYRAVRESGAVKSGEALVDRAVAAIPGTFARRLVRTVVPEGADMAGTVIGDLLAGRRSTGWWLALLGAAIVAGSFVAGPWLAHLIARG